jgi:hypothetical protein
MTHPTRREPRARLPQLHSFPWHLRSTLKEGTWKCMSRSCGTVSWPDQPSASTDFDTDLPPALLELDPRRSSSHGASTDATAVHAASVRRRPRAANSSAVTTADDELRAACAARAAPTSSAGGRSSVRGHVRERVAGGVASQTPIRPRTPPSDPTWSSGPTLRVQNAIIRLTRWPAAWPSPSAAAPMADDEAVPFAGSASVASRRRFRPSRGRRAGPAGGAADGGAAGQTQ